MLARDPTTQAARGGRLVAFALTALFFGAACAHEYAGHWDPASHRYCYQFGCYSVGALSPPWQVLRTGNGEVAFYNQSSKSVIQSNATCRDDADATSLTTLTEHLLIGYTEPQVSSRQTLPFAGREALRTIVRAKLDGVPMVLDLYVLKRNGCVFDLSYSARPDTYANGVSDFDRFVVGFRDERRS